MRVYRRARVETGALLGGLIYDDRSNIMSPSPHFRSRCRAFIVRRSDAIARRLCIASAV
jgi:hypothetical protein